MAIGNVNNGQQRALAPKPLKPEDKKKLPVKTGPQSTGKTAKVPGRSTTSPITAPPMSRPPITTRVAAPPVSTGNQKTISATLNPAPRWGEGFQMLHVVIPNIPNGTTDFSIKLADGTVISKDKIFGGINAFSGSATISVAIPKGIVLTGAKIAGKTVDGKTVVLPETVLPTPTVFHAAATAKPATPQKPVAATPKKLVHAPSYHPMSPRLHQRRPPNVEHHGVVPENQSPVPRKQVTFTPQQIASLPKKLRPIAAAKTFGEFIGMRKKSSTLFDPGHRAQQIKPDIWGHPAQPPMKKESQPAKKVIRTTLPSVSRRATKKISFKENLRQGDWCIKHGLYTKAPYYYSLALESTGTNTALKKVAERKLDFAMTIKRKNGDKDAS